MHFKVAHSTFDSAIVCATESNVFEVVEDAAVGWVCCLLNHTDHCARCCQRLISQECRVWLWRRYFERCGDLANVHSGDDVWTTH